MLAVEHSICAHVAVSISDFYFYDMEKFRKLTPHDLAFGIGRPATDEELKELLSRPTGKGKPLEQAIEDIKKRIAENRLKKAS